MSGLSVVNKQTILKRLSNHASIGIVFLTAYFVGDCVITQQKDAEYKEKMEVINQAVTKHDFEMAKKLLGEYKEKEVLKAGDESIFELAIKRGEENYNLEKKKKTNENKLITTLEKQEIDSARAVLRDIKNIGTHTTDEIKSLEDKIYAETEEGMFNKWISAVSEDQTEICEKYLEKYENGKYAQEAIKEILIYDFKKAMLDISENESHNIILNDARTINFHLQKYSNKKTKLGKILDIDSFIKKLDEYNDRAADSVIKPNIFGKVKFKRTLENYWDPEYVNQRKRTIPTGTEGRVILVYEDGNVIVQFPSTEHHSWQVDNKYWRVAKSYWSKGQINVAEFRMEELSGEQSIYIEKNRLKEEARNIMANFKAYR